MIRIDINNEQTIFAISPALKKTVKRAARTALDYLGIGNEDLEISLTFTDNEKIRLLNAEYRNKDSATDVLSFPLVDWELEGDDDVSVPGMPLFLGDIIISLERAYSQARQNGNPFFREVAFLTVHSTLHLMGFDHETNKEDEEEMFSLQDEIMKIFDNDRAC